MADPITGAIVSGLVKLILDKLGSPLFKQLQRSFGVKSELKRLRTTLSAIDDVLLDAEEQQTTQVSVRNWLLDLKDVARDIEDVLDLISTQALEDTVRGRTLVQKLRGVLPQFGLSRKLKAICRRLEEVSANRSKFNLKVRQVTVDAPPAHTNNDRDQSPIIQESATFGRKEDKNQIVSRLVSSSSHEISEIPVLPIIGIGGMGKTTLAKLVFNDRIVGANFSLKLWVSLPREFSKKIVIDKIFEYVASGSNMRSIEQAVHEELAGKTFLLVLDNVWASTPSNVSNQTFRQEWIDLREFLEVGSMSSSRILVTTREDKVVSIIGSMEAYKLKPLSDDACWSIFAKHAFKCSKEEEQRPLLVEIGKEIVRKCYGVPLAARTLGSLLVNVRDKAEWKRIEQSELWKMEQTQYDILPALKLSFDELPYYLKGCFSFCSTRRGTEISRNEMEEYWMALGLTESRDNNGIMEDSGTRYFDELVSRSFFEPLLASRLIDDLDSDSNSEYLDVLDSSTLFETLGGFQMHDLVYDLGRYIALAREETTFVSFDTHEVSSRVEHLVWTEENCFEREFPCQLLPANKVRSFWVDSKKGDHLSTTFLHSLISSFRCLRILSINGFKFEELPDSIGDSKHLRCLELDWNIKLKSLPDSISKLVNLQTLMVRGCTQLEIFPKNLHRWISLRHLYFTSKLDSCLETCYRGWTSIRKVSIQECAYLKSLPEELGILTTLRFLRIWQCPNLGSLPNSIQLLTSLEQLDILDCGKLNLSGWQGLNGLRNLRVLHIDELPLLEDFPDGLQHCTSLLKLIINFCENLSTLPKGIDTLKSLQRLCMFEISPILVEKCEREIGEDWKLISHIPSIHVLSS